MVACGGAERPQRLLGRLLLGRPAAGTLAVDLDPRGLEPADHGEVLGMAGTADTLDGVGGQRMAAALQELLQPGLGIAQVVPGVERRQARSSAGSARPSAWPASRRRGTRRRRRPRAQFASIDPRRWPPERNSPLPSRTSSPSASSRATSSSVSRRTSRARSRLRAPSSAPGCATYSASATTRPEDGVAQELQPLVISAAGTAVREGQLQQPVVLKAVAECARGPFGRHAHFRISTELSKLAVMERLAI